MSAPSDPDARPSKRARLSPSADPTSTSTSTAAPPSTASAAPQASQAPIDDDLDREVRAGITEYVSPDNRGFAGVLKQRYVDFLVNEIGLDGVVVHLRDTKARKKEGNVKKEERLQVVDKAPVKEKKPEEVTEQTTEVGQEEKFTLKFEDGEAEEKEKTPAKSAEAPAISGEEPEKLSETKAEPKTENGEAELEVSEENLTTLRSIFGQDATAQIVTLVRQVRRHGDRKARDFNAVIAPPIVDKETRTQAHQSLRRIFPNMLESSMESDQSIRIKALPPRERNPGKNKGRNKGRGRGDDADPDPQRHRGTLAWEEKGGEYLHFTMYKENKDTMEVIGFLGSKMGCGTRPFTFAGTKDRRACTAQRVSVKRQTAEQLAGLNKILYNAALGDFEYKKHDLNLGDLLGNEFVITLRDTHFEGEEGLGHAQRLQLANEIVIKSIKDFVDNGFINYYGLQRFGSFSASTDKVGLRMLKGDLKGAIDDLLSYNEVALAAADNSDETILISKDDKQRAKGLHIWRTTGKGQNAIDQIPRKFTAERNIIQHLSSRNGKTGLHDRKFDYQGALGCIPRNLRLMYVHAYQSLVWNVVAGKRWTLYGDKVVEGDLVLVHEHRHKVSGPAAIAREAVDENGEMVINPFGEDSALKDDDRFERARALTADEATSGLYTIQDVVLPQPGFDVEYPKNAVGEFYKEFMASERGGGLDPHSMRRPWKEVSLSGGYRKFLARPLKELESEIREYVSEEEELVETDLQRLQKAQAAGRAGKSGVQNGSENVEMKDADVLDKASEHEKKIAVVLKMQLASSQYATIALRELMKAGGVRAFKPEYFSGAR